MNYKEILNIYPSAFIEYQVEDKTKTFQSTSVKSGDLDINICDILEGFGCSSEDNKSMLFWIEDLRSTLNPEFDSDYEDPYADIWDAFVKGVLTKNVDILIYEGVRYL